MGPAMWKIAILSLVFVAASAAVPAHEIKSGDLTIVHPFVRATAPRAQVGGGYMRIVNTGDEEDRLIAIEAPSACERVTLHSTVVTDGIAKMVRLEGLVVPAHGGAILGSERTYAMFQGLTAPFAEGQIIDATLVFEKAGRVEMTFEVEALTADPMETVHSH
jgi:periplasmic copper chaperone A